MTLKLFFKRIVFAALRPEKAVSHPIDMICYFAKVICFLEVSDASLFTRLNFQLVTYPGFT